MVANSGGGRGIVAGVGYAIALTSALTLTLGGFGCDKPPPDPAQVSALHFTTSTSLPSNPPPAVDVTVADAATARAAYERTLALPEFPPGTYNCPFDFGVRYRLDFMSGPSLAVTVTANPNGCGEVQIPGTNTRRALPSDYWAALAQTLGIDESMIYPYPAR